MPSPPLPPRPLTCTPPHFHPALSLSPPPHFHPAHSLSPPPHFHPALSLLHVSLQAAPEDGQKDHGRQQRCPDRGHRRHPRAVLQLPVHLITNAL